MFSRALRNEHLNISEGVIRKLSELMVNRILYAIKKKHENGGNPVPFKQLAEKMLARVIVKIKNGLVKTKKTVSRGCRNKVCKPKLRRAVSQEQYSMWSAMANLKISDEGSK